MYMKHRHSWSLNLGARTLAVLGLLASLIGTNGLAQTTTGTIRGTVTGAGGVPIVSSAGGVFRGRKTATRDIRECLPPVVSRRQLSTFSSTARAIKTS